MLRDLRIVFMGTPDFAVGVLKAMVESGKNIVGVITAPDRPAGRGRKLTESAVKKYALEKQLKILQPSNLKDESFLSELNALQANLQVVVAFRMLPKQVWSLPKYGTFNLHASLLPEYRGAAPINWAIINGEKTSGVTTFFIDEKIDTGAIIAKEEIAIESTETAGSLHDKLMETGSQLVLKTLELIEKDEAKPIPQPKQTDLKEAPKLTPENTRIDWNRPGKEIEYFIRGLSPYPAAWTVLQQNNEELKELKVKIYNAVYIKEAQVQKPGSIFADKKELKIAVSDGYISVLEMQIPGKRKMDIVSLLNGFTFSEDAIMR